eukprot:4698970-Alexandrium_andersonii.AAC.1
MLAPAIGMRTSQRSAEQLLRTTACYRVLSRTTAYYRVLPATLAQDPLAHFPASDLESPVPPGPPPGGH